MRDRRLYAFYPVVKPENLSAAVKLFLYCVGENYVIVFKNICLNGKPVARSFFENRHIAYAAHRHIQCSRNRGCGERQNIDILCYLFKFLLLRNPKTLFLVDYQQSKIFKNDIPSDNSVSADDYVKLSAAEAPQSFSLLRLCAET